jgi:uncharacterized membrane protein
MPASSLVVVALGVTSLGLTLAGLYLFAILVPLLALTAALAWRRGTSVEGLFVLLLVSTALLLSLGVEVFYMRDFMAGGDLQRMNTIFKFYIQIWVFLGIAAGLGLARLAPTHAQARPVAHRWPRFAAFAPGIVWSSVFGVLLVSVLVYPVLGTIARVTDRFPGARPPVGTLDGMAFMSVGTYTWENRAVELKYDYDAIQWLLRNVQGSPVVAEAAIGYYREFGVRVASFTGLPTLVGMHQGEQRYDWQVGRRDGDARTFFTEPSYERVASIAQKLHVKYIYVGQLEHIVYPAVGLAKFDAAVGKYLDLAYENPRTKVYKVR